MASKLEISVIVSTYQRPAHLRRCLASLAAQRGVAGRLEVVVTDDGSRDDTPDVVARFRREVDFPVEFVTHPHDGFRQSFSRNQGVLASTAPYLLFTDGDCIFAADHLQQQLAARRPGVVRAGECFRIDEATSAKIDDLAVSTGRFEDSLKTSARRWSRRLYRKALFYQLTNNRIRPKLTGWSMAMSRTDLERINGFDERYRGWGCEDDDLANRLRASGVRVLTGLGYTHGYHLWHAIDPTAPTHWSRGANVGYLCRPLRLTRCLAGLSPRTIEDAAIRLVVDDDRHRFARQVLDGTRTALASPELEILFWPCRGRFSPHADCRVLVVAKGDRVPRSISRSAHATIEVADWNDPAAVRRELESLLGLDHGSASQTAAGQDAA